VQVLGQSGGAVTSATVVEAGANYALTGSPITCAAYHSASGAGFTVNLTSIIRGPKVTTLAHQGFCSGGAGCYFFHATPSADPGGLTVISSDYGTAVNALKDETQSPAVTILPAGSQSGAELTYLPTGPNYKASHNVFVGNAPAVSSCGGGSPSVSGTDNAGTITIGTGGITACTLTFASTWAQVPVCRASTSTTTAFASVTAASATAITIGLSASLASGNIYYDCGCVGTSCA
jgi:hypothetical protein